MKKYRVITDNLDWHEVIQGEILHQDEDGFWATTNSYPLFDRKEFNRLLKLHSDWFEEIQESVSGYTKQEVIDFAAYMIKSPNTKHTRYFEDVFNEWIKNKKQ